MTTVTGYVRMLNSKGPGLEGHVRLRLLDDPASEIVFEGPCRANCMAAFRASMNSRLPVEVTLSDTREVTTAKLIGPAVQETPSKPTPKKPNSITPPIATEPPQELPAVPEPIVAAPIVVAPQPEPEDESLDDFLSLMGS